jgi:2-hydroxy-4-carboxymuconate semialdehyde hemiacetal dehydrogenase
MKVILAGAGAFGQKHLDAVKAIGGIDVVSLVGRELEGTRSVGAKYGIPHVTTDLQEALARPGVDAAILCTPTQLHAGQALQCMEAGKHVQVEIPLGSIDASGRGSSRFSSLTCKRTSSDAPT